jgi:hypothetical protein
MTWAVELRLARDLVERFPLATAFLISILIHLFLFGGYRMGKQFGWWDYQATWLIYRQKVKNWLMPQSKVIPPFAQPPRKREIPLEFVEVNPAVAVAEPPKETVYYGPLHSVAANPEPAKQDTGKPKLDGTQTQLVRVEDVPRPTPKPLQPAAEPEPVVVKTAAPAETPAKAAETPGDLAKVKTEEIKRPSEGVADLSTAPPKPAARPRPRTLAEARAARGMVAGERMKQDGGVRRRGTISLDVKATAFGAYDAAFIAAVQERWYQLIDNSPAVPRSGKVVLDFRLHQGGQISDLVMAHNEVGELLALLCQKAVRDPAPYAKWPDDMRRLVGRPHREIRFTFFYN